MLGGMFSAPYHQLKLNCSSETGKAPIRVEARLSQTPQKRTATSQPKGFPTLKILIPMQIE
jgi:hypothetical protein